MNADWTSLIVGSDDEMSLALSIPLSGDASERNTNGANHRGPHLQFRENGADIPNELIEAVADGSATFLCGAGVSFRVGLPLFETLTTQVYEELGEKPDDEPAERNALERKEFDRALRSLEKRTHRPGTLSRVRKAVSQLLTAPADPLPDHTALLQLSKDIEGRSRFMSTRWARTMLLSRTRC